MTAGGRHPEARLLVLGEDSGAGGVSEKARLQALARELGMAGRVDFLGSVAQPRLRMRGTGRCVSLSKNAASTWWNWPRKTTFWTP